MHETERVLRIGVALGGCLTKPPDGLGVICGDFFAREVHFSKQDLSNDDPLLCCPAKPLDRLLGVPWHPSAKR